MGDWFMHTVSFQSFDYNTEAWIRKAISKYLKKYQDTNGFNCGRI